MLALKMAWIQYLTILIPVAVIAYFILLFLFKNQIFQTALTTNLPPNNKKVY